MNNFYFIFFISKLKYISNDLVTVKYICESSLRISLQYRRRPFHEYKRRKKRFTAEFCWFARCYYNKQRTSSEKLITAHNFLVSYMKARYTSKIVIFLFYYPLSFLFNSYLFESLVMLHSLSSGICFYDSGIL